MNRGASFSRRLVQLRLCEAELRELAEISSSIQTLQFSGFLRQILLIHRTSVHYTTRRLALAVVVSDLVQEEFLNGVHVFGLVEEDGGEADVPAQRNAER